MTSIERSTLDRMRQIPAAGRQLWFLSGSLQSREPLRHLPIEESVFSVGRKAGSSLKLQHATVSGEHATLSERDGQLFLRDLGSTNGTFVNGERVRGEVIIREEDLIHFAEAPFRVLRQSSLSLSTGTLARNVCDEALALVQFDRMMSDKLVRPHSQPIVDMASNVVVGVEVLGRGSMFGLESVGDMFHAASQLNLEVELSELLRWEGVRLGRDRCPCHRLFVNTHPREIDDVGKLVDSLVKLRKMCGSTELVLEIHEASITNPHAMRHLSTAVRDLQMELAFDDFGSGQARLAELIEAKPHYVKFDISLIHDIDLAGPPRRRMLESLVQMVRDLNVRALAEGIETEAEAKVCREVGFDLAQGFFFGRPAPM